MKSDFVHASGSHSYFAASIAALKRLFRPGNQVNCAKDTNVPPPAVYSTTSDRQNIYRDPDPPTPHWGC
jgi:hypothetical protein